MFDIFPLYALVRSAVEVGRHFWQHIHSSKFNGAPGRTKRTTSHRQTRAFRAPPRATQPTRDNRRRL